MIVQKNFNGISDTVLRFVEEKQLKDRSVWKLLVKQFAIGNVDDEDLGWRGEYWGKLMRGACMTYQYTGDEELYDILTTATIDLIAAQDEEGRIATYSKETEFQGWDMWSRKYVLLGLIYYHSICKDDSLKEKAVSAACRHLDYIIAHVGEEEGKISITRTSPVWRGINSSSILEPVVRMYALTGNKCYLDFASYIVEHGGAEGFHIFEAAYEDKLYPYQYPVVKAYELMSCFEGLIWYYKVTGIEKWRTASENFVKRLLESETTVVGGLGCEHELFNHSSLMQTYGGYQGLMLETCVTVTWMRLLYAMYQITGCSLYMDGIERSAFNALYGAVNTKEAVCGPETGFDLKHYRGVYEHYIAGRGKKGQVFDSYSPLMKGIRGRAVGGFKAMENGTAFSGCCIVIGAAGVALVPDAAVHTTQNGLAVGLYLPGNMVLENVGPDKAKVSMEMNTAYPADGRVEITLQEIEGREAEFEIALRIPAFAKGSTVQVNDTAASEVICGDYVRLNRKWQTGDKIILNIAMNPRMVFGMRNQEDPESEKRFAVLYGPLALAKDKRLGQTESPVILTEKIMKLKPYQDKVPFSCQCAFTVQIDGNEIPMVDYASAGKTWRRDSEMEVWLESTCGMFESKNAKANTVSSKNQLTDDKRISIVREEGSRLKVLFVGNSITRHAPKPSIGWHHDWGMAASAKEKDYVHLVVKGLKERYGAIDYCVAQMADWECEYTKTEEILQAYYQHARDFGADIIIIRICENIKSDMHEEISCKPYFDKMIQFMITEKAKQVIVTDSFWRRDNIDQVIQEIIEERGYTYCKLSDLELDEKTMAFGLFEHTGVAAHPSDYGMACIAERILDCIEK